MPSIDGHRRRTRYLHLRRLGRRRQDDHLGGARRGARRTGPEGRRADDRPRQAARGLPRPRGARQHAQKGRPQALRALRRRDEGRALGDDARRQGDLRRPRAQARAGRRDARPHPREPHLQAALQRPGRLAGVHGDGEALRDPPGGPLRLPGARYAALPQRPRLPRRAQAAHPVHRGPRDADVHEADRVRHQGRRPGQLDGDERAEARHRAGPAHRPERVLPGVQRDGGRVPGARQAGLRAARRPRHHLRRGLRPAGRARQRGRLLPPQAGRGQAARRGRDRQQGPLRGR